MVVGYGMEVVHGCEEEAKALHARLQGGGGPARTSGKTPGQIARELDLTAVRGWIKQAEIDAGHQSNGELTTSEREKLARLRRESKVLQMERETLRKRRPLRQGDDVKFAFVAVEKASFAVSVLCNGIRSTNRVRGSSRSDRVVSSVSRARRA